MSPDGVEAALDGRRGFLLGGIFCTESTSLTWGFDQLISQIPDSVVVPEFKAESLSLRYLVGERGASFATSCERVCKHYEALPRQANINEGRLT